MYLDHFNLNRSPFREEPDPVFFFPEAGRLDTLLALVRDIEGGKPLIKLVGREGTGKTLFALLLTRKLPAGYDIVRLDNPVGSFEELLHAVCLELGMRPAADVTATTLADEFRGQLVRRGEQERKVLLIIDEAEKLFLATLERLVRLACDAGAAGVLHLLFIGRPDFDANFKRLAVYCSGVDVNAGYALEPLSPEETGRYLSFRLVTAGVPETKPGGIFAEEAVVRVYQAAMGNMRQTNILAEDALRKACAEDALLVLPEHVNSRFPAEKPARRRLFPWSGVAPRNRMWLAGGAAVLVILLLVAVWSGGRKENSPAVIHRQQVGPVEQVKPLKQVKPVKSADKAAKKSVGRRDRKAAPVVEKRKKTTTGRSAAKKKKPGVAPVKVAPPPGTRNRKGPGQEVHKEKTATVAGRNGNKLYEERMRASSRWLAWAYRGGFTIQLMMLSSEQARSHLESILVRDDYYAIKDNLYILSKTSPPVLFVFYGLYDTIEDARKACGKLPDFLKKHHPYALAIRGALKKTED
ncbi:MAG: AAA family ATPase [Proteobacteria bacterium]|nr:AAA family ATPase [Pseudomonadota bacterium]